MLPISLHERHHHIDADFPIEYYYVDVSHPRFAMPMHWHHEWEILTVTHGSATFRINEREMQASEGDVLLISGGLLHSGDPSDSLCTYECIVFPLSGLFSVSAQAYRAISVAASSGFFPQIFFPKQAFPFISSQVRLLMDTCSHVAEQTGGSSSWQGARLVSIACIIQILGQIFTNDLFEKTIRQDDTSHIEKVKDVLDYIAQNYSSPITLELLASVASMSPKYFCDVFRRITQRTPMEYVIFYRIEQACIMLFTEPISITDVSLNCGFNDSSYFTRRFKAQIGMTPSQYRKKMNRASFPATAMST